MVTRKLRRIYVLTASAVTAAAALGGYWALFGKHHNDLHVTVRLRLDAPSADPYGRSFSCFVAFEGESGIYVPLRYALSPRKGFMDEVSMVRRVQSPSLHVIPGAHLPGDVVVLYDDVVVPYEISAPARAVIVGHQTGDEDKWIVSKFKDYVIPVSKLLDKSYLASEGEAAAAIEALNWAKKKYDEIMNSEP